MNLLHSNLKDKVVVITGGAGVLCSTMVLELVRQSCKVASLDRRAESGQELATKVKEAGGSGQFLPVQCDVLSEEAVKVAKQKVNETFGEVDILINGAGGNNPKATTNTDTYTPGDEGKEGVNSFFSMTTEGFNAVFSLNFMGTFIPTQVFASDLIKKPARQIINISSMSAFYPMTRGAAYGAAKAAINNFTMWMAVHFADVGLRVNAIAPGFFLTTQNKTLLTNPDGSLTPRSGKIMAHTPMKKFGQPSDLLGPLLWLLDEEESGFVTGHIIPVDGGFMAYSGV